MGTKLTADELNAKLPYAFGDELVWLRSIANEIQTCVVLGAGPGIMSMALLESNPDMDLIAVDNNQQVLDTYEKHLEAAGISEYVVWYTTTTEAAIEWEGDAMFRAAFGLVDLLIVDADHSKQAVEDDLKAWLPHVMRGGLIFFHDYVDLEQNGTNGVAEVVDALDKERFPEVARPGISVVVRKT